MGDKPKWDLKAREKALALPNPQREAMTSNFVAGSDINCNAR